MATDMPHIAPYLFERQFEAFRTFVEEKSPFPFVSFFHQYIDQQEGYKYEVHAAGRKALAFQNWKQSEIGSGDIAEAVIKAIEISDNNLVPWPPIHGEKARPHQPLFEAKNQQDKLLKIEKCLFNLYHEEQNEKSLAELIDIFGRSYPLLSYLFFLKDRSRYIPIRPKTMDRAFKYLGADFKTDGQCSWENYSFYVGLLGEIKDMLTKSLAVEVTLLDAHSFAWMLASQMEHEKKLADTQEYQSLSSTEREANDRVMGADQSEEISDFTDEYPPGTTFPEGQRTQVLVNRYERDRGARDACIKHHGARCVVCGLSMGETYGPLGEGFIHVHHLVPISKIGEGYVVNPVTDLVPVCPNCHTMLHRQNPPLTINDLKSRLS